jgi:hypothetical protein
MSLIRARELIAALGQWAASDGTAEPDDIWQAVVTAGTLESVLMDLWRTAEAHSVWSLPGYPFARTGGGCLHARGCFYVLPELDWHQPLTPGQAEEFLRESHNHRRCTACVPGIPEAPWVRVRSPGGQVRWRLADDVVAGL